MESTDSSSDPISIHSSVSTSNFKRPPIAFLDTHKKARSLAKLEKPTNKLLSSSNEKDPKGPKPTLIRRNSVTVDGSVLPTVRKTIADYYAIDRLLGEGVSSQVFLAKNKKSGEMVAIKSIPKNILINNSQLCKEIKILKTISHKYIIGMKDVFITEKHLQIVMELADGYELFDHICQRRTFTEKDAKSILIKLLDALAYLHNEGIVHRDLKPENIMFVQSEDGTSNLKLIDFGFARNCKEQNILEAPTGTLGYKAPEILSQQPYSTKTDMWSLGVITYILLVGFPPFFSNPEHWDDNSLSSYPFWYLFNEETDNLLSAIKSGKVEYPDHFWLQINPEAKDFVGKLLKVDPAERLSAMDALRHPWLKPVTHVLMGPVISTNSLHPNSDSTTLEIEVPEKDETDDTTEEEESDDEIANLSPKSDINEADKKVLPSQNNLPAFCQILKNTPSQQKMIKEPNPEFPSVKEQLLAAEFVPSGIPALDTLSSVYAKTDEAPEVDMNVEKTTRDDLTTDGNKETHEGDTKKQLKSQRKLYRHQWRKVTGTFCSQCDYFIYGLHDKHGYKCKNCKLVVHRDCRQNVAVNCFRSRRRRQAAEDSLPLGGQSPRKSKLHQSKNTKGKSPEASPRERRSRRESKYKNSPTKNADLELRSSRPMRSRGDLAIDVPDLSLASKGKIDSKYNHRDSPFLPSFTRENDNAPKTKSQRFRRTSNGMKEDTGKFHSPRPRKTSFGSKESLDRILNSARRMGRPTNNKEDYPSSSGDFNRKRSVGNFPSPRKASHSKTECATPEIQSLHGSEKSKLNSLSPRTSTKKATRTTERTKVEETSGMIFSSPELPLLHLQEEEEVKNSVHRHHSLHHSHKEHHPRIVDAHNSSESVTRKPSEGTPLTLSDKKGSVLYS